MKLWLRAILSGAGITLLSCGSGDHAPATSTHTDSSIPAAAPIDTMVSPEADTIYRGGSEPSLDPDSDISP